MPARRESGFASRNVMKVSFGRWGGPLDSAPSFWGAPLALCEAPWERGGGAGSPKMPQGFAPARPPEVAGRLARGMLFGGSSGQMRRPQEMFGGALPRAGSPSGFGAVQRFFGKFRGFWAFRRVGLPPSSRSGRRLFWGPCAHGGSGLRGPWRLPVARRQSLVRKAFPGLNSRV